MPERAVDAVTKYLGKPVWRITGNRPRSVPIDARHVSNRVRIILEIRQMGGRAVLSGQHGMEPPGE